MARRRDARLAAAALAVDPAGLGGAVVRARAGPARDEWLALLRRLAGDAVPLRRLAPGIADDRLLGGLDLAATLRTGRPVRTRGLLAEAEGAILILPMGERATQALAGRLALAMDGGGLPDHEGSPRKGFGLVVLDEGAEPDECAPAALADRLAFHVDLDGLGTGKTGGDAAAEEVPVAEARARLRAVGPADEAAGALAEAASLLGIDSLRAPLLALRAARVLAALAGRNRVAEGDVADAARLVLAPRATMLPAEETETEAAEEDAQAPAPEQREQAEGRERREGTLEDRVLEAVRAALPEGLFSAPPARRRGGGEAGAGARSLARRGRPAPSRRGKPEGSRLDLIATLRAAAPWQPLRRAEIPAALRREDSEPEPGRTLHGRPRDGAPSADNDNGNGDGATARRVVVLPEDFRVRRFVRPAESVLIFVVDASGSAAAARLAEAKGAVELMLARAYARREKVALIAFRGTAAELLLPPTRSLVQARRRLAVLPGGGGTPLASGLAAAVGLAAQVRRRGATPFVALLTDGRGNVALDGTPGRARAAEDTQALARRLAGDGIDAVVIDTANRPQAAAAALAAEMRGRYLPLPRADAAAMGRALGAAVGAVGGARGGTPRGTSRGTAA